MVTLTYDLNRPLMEKDGITVDEMLANLRKYAKETGEYDDDCKKIVTEFKVRGL